jgi:hypothetical protein
MPINRDFLHEDAKNPQVQQAAGAPPVFFLKIALF